MEQDIAIVRNHYNANAQQEWDRLAEHPFEFTLTTYMMERLIQPGESILDIGGGPGRYAIHFAQRGNSLTLVDLSEGNVRLANEKASDAGVVIDTHVANCLDLEPAHLGQYDHVFLMGPMYHLLDPADQKAAVEIALSHLKPGGKLYVSFIMVFAGILFTLKNSKTIVPVTTAPDSSVLIDDVITGDDYCGPAFTQACFMHQSNILPFMEQFPLKKLHFFGQEGILAPNEQELLQREPEEIACWIEIAKKFIEVPELLSYSEHAMYIGKKI